MRDNEVKNDNQQAAVPSLDESPAAAPAAAAIPQAPEEKYKQIVLEHFSQAKKDRKPRQLLSDLAHQINPKSGSAEAVFIARCRNTNIPIAQLAKHSALKDLELTPDIEKMLSQFVSVYPRFLENLKFCFPLVQPFTPVTIPLDPSWLDWLLQARLQKFLAKIAAIKAGNNNNQETLNVEELQLLCLLNDETQIREILRMFEDSADFSGGIHAKMRWGYDIEEYLGAIYSISTIHYKNILSRYFRGHFSSSVSEHKFAAESLYNDMALFRLGMTRTSSKALSFGSSLTRQNLRKLSSVIGVLLSGYLTQAEQLPLAQELFDNDMYAFVALIYRYQRERRFQPEIRISAENMQAALMSKEEKLPDFSKKQEILFNYDDFDRPFQQLAALVIRSQQQADLSLELRFVYYGYLWQHKKMVVTLLALLPPERIAVDAEICLPFPDLSHIKCIRSVAFHHGEVDDGMLQMLSVWSNIQRVTFPSPVLFEVSATRINPYLAKIFASHNGRQVVQGLTISRTFAECPAELTHLTVRISFVENTSLHALIATLALLPVLNLCLVLEVVPEMRGELSLDFLAPLFANEVLQTLTLKTAFTTYMQYVLPKNNNRLLAACQKNRNLQSFVVEGSEPVFFAGDRVFLAEDIATIAHCPFLRHIRIDDELYYHDHQPAALDALICQPLAHMELRRYLRNRLVMEACWNIHVRHNPYVRSLQWLSDPNLAPRENGEQKESDPILAETLLPRYQHDEMTLQAACLLVCYRANYSHSLRDFILQLLPTLLGLVGPHWPKTHNDMMQRARLEFTRQLNKLPGSKHFPQLLVQANKPELIVFDARLKQQCLQELVYYYRELEIIRDDKKAALVKKCTKYLHTTRANFTDEDIIQIRNDGRLVAIIEKYLELFPPNFQDRETINNLQVTLGQCHFSSGN